MSETESTSPAPPAWKPLSRVQRRVAGVLIEKSKTTPDVYPMSLNGIKTGSNQKSNRSPQMDLQEHEVEDVLYQLRHLGAAVEIQAGGRVPKFKHQMYEWLAVEKDELAVMAELLLRGEQTIGELRGRAARMEKSITGVNELKPVLSSLKEKNLIVELTPAGRGQVITHNLYQPDEIDRLRKQFGTEQPPARAVEIATPTDAQTVGETPIASPPTSSTNTPSPETTQASRIDLQARPRDSVDSEKIESLQSELDELKKVVSQLRQDLSDLTDLIES